MKNYFYLITYSFDGYNESPGKIFLKEEDAIGYAKELIEKYDAELWFVSLYRQSVSSDSCEVLEFYKPLYPEES